MNVCVFASNNGSNFEEIAKTKYQYVNICLLVVNKKTAYAIERAKKLNIPYVIIDYTNKESSLVEEELIKVLDSYKIDFIVLAGFMKILTDVIINRYPNRIINIHPSLLPNYRGLNAIQKAFNDSVLESGVTVHYVNNELDAGKIIKQVSFKNIYDNIEDFENKIHEIEYSLYKEVIKELLDKKPTKVLIIGSGGREHAITYSIYSSFINPIVYTTSSNPGITYARKVDIKETDIEKLKDFCLAEEIDLTIVGPENVISLGISDLFLKHNLKIFAPTKNASLIETSKEFAKKLMDKYNIKTAKYKVFNDYHKALSYLDKFPVVIKYDGLALGKGVCVCYTYEEAQTALSDMLLDKVFGNSSVIIEEFLDGVEYSHLGLVNYENVLPLEIAKDHKRAFDFDKGPNTGGMGAYSPVDCIDKETIEYSKTQILEKIANALVKENVPFTGCLYAGLIKCSDGVYVIEFNCRFGDPETEVILPRLESDLLDVILNLLEGNKVELKWNDSYCLGVVMASCGYPKEYQKGFIINNSFQDGIFHMGTTLKDGEVVTNGGRVLMVTSLGKTLQEAKTNTYKKVSKVSSNNLFYRNDIGGIS